MSDFLSFSFMYLPEEGGGLTKMSMVIIFSPWEAVKKNLNGQAIVFTPPPPELNGSRNFFFVLK